jgi:hypothetical protein
LWTKAHGYLGSSAFSGTGIPPRILKIYRDRYSRRGAGKRIYKDVRYKSAVGSCIVAADWG